MAAQATETRVDPITATLGRIKDVFASSPTKHAGHEQAAAIVRDAALDPEFLTASLRHFLAEPESLARENYPVIGIVLDSNPDFDLVAHAWIPHPDGETNLTTKAIHHHGELLLTTATAFGPGYEHWTFTTPTLVNADRDLWSMKLIDNGPHALHEIAFVDAGVAHVPMFPADLSVTYCLWSTRSETTWKDSLKRVPLLQRHSATLRRLVTRAGLARTLEVKNAEYFDFYPGAEGFNGVPEREEFRRGPNADHVRNVLYVLQRTGNEQLADDFERALAAGRPAEESTARELLGDLRAGTPIEPRLSSWHFDVPEANFRRADIERALAALS